MLFSTLTLKKNNLSAKQAALPPPVKANFFSNWLPLVNKYFKWMVGGAFRFNLINFYLHSTKSQQRLKALYSDPNSENKIGFSADSQS